MLGLLAGGCVTHRSQLRDPVPATDELAGLARHALASQPLPSNRRAQIALEFQDQVFVALGFFAVEGPASYHTELATPFGVTLLEVLRDGEGAHAVSGAEPLQRLVRMGKLPRVLALWLLGSCEEGEVLDGSNAVAVDCPANGPDEGLTWRVWLDRDVLNEQGDDSGDASAFEPRVRGELLQGKKLLADFICQPDGDCLLQDPVHGYVLRMVASSTVE